MPSSETLPLAEDKPSRVYYVQDTFAHDTHQFYSRHRREQLQLRCFIYIVTLAMFTMALIVTVSYSVSQDTMDNGPNLTSQTLETQGNLTSPLKLGFAPGSGSYTLFNNVASMPSSKSFFVGTKGANSTMSGLTDAELQKGLQAGQLAIEARLTADAMAQASPLPSPSPESRHRYAVSTCVSVRNLALAAVAELAATRKIEMSRLAMGEPSAMGSHFDGSWIPKEVCKEMLVLNCTGSKYRTYDGTCNRPMQWGASMTPYRRLLPPSYADGIDQPRKAQSGKDLPSAREISLKVHKPSPSSNPAFTVMLAVYGQFLDHDITATAISQGINGSSISCCPPAFGHPECFPVNVGAGDPVFDVTGRTCMDFVRSAPAPQCKLGPRQQLNQVTAFIDGSTVYGSDAATARDLREFAGGRLRMQLTPDNRTLLPPSTNPTDGCNRDTERLRGRYCFAAGDARANENLHLTTMHLLWARQHNKIAGDLSRINPTWNDETLYQEARRVVGAQMQHITYEEFVPIVLGEQDTSMRGLRPLKSGYREWTESPDDPVNDPSIANNFASAAFRFAHTLLPGLMRVTDAAAGTSSYVELHRMLFNPYSLYAEGGVASSVTTATSNVIQKTSTHVTSQLTSHLFEDPISNTTLPCGLDLVSLNIQRGRDHGLPGYTSWREYCGIGKTETFADLQGHLDPQVLEEMSMLYESVHDVDLYTGALAEIPKPGSIVGPTFACLIADQFARLQKGDRFWYEVPNQPHSFTESQLQELRKTSLARIICDVSDGVTQTQAEVMRSVGPENPMMSCEDIPRPSFESWKEDTSMGTPMLRATLTPFDWVDLKNNINDTVRDIITFINGTVSSGTPATTDWLAFKNYINNSFADLRNKLNALHPPKVVENMRSTEKMSGDGSFILRAAAPPSTFQDWINFKINLVKSLNDSIGTITPGPADFTKWIAFKQNIINQFADLNGQINAMNMELAPKMLLEKYKQEQAAMSKANMMVKPTRAKESAVPIPAVFDWKNFKDNIIQSLDDAIINIGDNMPPPGDPAWATFGADIKDRFAALHDKINTAKSTPPTELATGAAGVGGDWLAFKGDITKTVSNAVQNIHDGMPAPGDPAWATFGPDIMKSFSAFKTKTPKANYIPAELASSPRMIEAAGFGGASPKITAGELSNLTVDWLEFRNNINDSLTRIIQDIQSKKPAPLDPLGWVAFKSSTMNDFAQFKNDIVNIKAEWVAKITNATGKPNPMMRPMSPSLKKAAPFGGFNKFNYPPNPIIPPADWADFKKQINDTLTNILNEARATEKIDIDEIQEAYNKSFLDLKNEIASLKDIITKNVSTPSDELPAVNPADIWKTQAAQWANFRTQINSTINDLLDSLKNESQTTIAEVMKTLFQTKDKLAGLEPPPSYSMGVQPMDWTQFIIGVNKTVADTLKNVNNLAPRALMMTAAEPVPSSSGRLKIFVIWLILPCILTCYTTLHLPIFRSKTCTAC